MSEAGLRSEEYCEKKLRQERHGRCFVRIGILGGAGPGHVKENKSVGLGKEQRGKRCVTAMGGGERKAKGVDAGSAICEVGGSDWEPLALVTCCAEPGD